MISFAGDSGMEAGNNLLFEVDAADTDLLEAANAAWSKLTPEQRAVDLKTIMNDASLWPEKVKCLGAFTLDSGKDIPPGQEFGFMSIDGSSPAASAWSACARPISPPSAATNELRAIFWALNGATR